MPETTKTAETMDTAEKSGNIEETETEETIKSIEPSPAKYTKQQFINWILDRDLSRWNVEQTENSIKLECDVSKGDINFYPGEQDEDVVEMMITSKKDNAMKFYLHFELVEPEHAQELYLEMEKELEKVQDDKNLNILLSCTSGATTLFFAEKLNQAAQALELPYSFNAVSYLDLFEHAPSYDMILLAPQIAYLFKKLKTAIPDKLVLTMPTSTFARFDASSAIDFIKEEVETYKEEKAKLLKEQECKECACCQIHKKSILVIAIIQDGNYTNCAYRILKNGEIILRETWLVDAFTPELYFDIINRALVADKSIKIIAISTPGIVNPNKTHYVMPNQWETEGEPLPQQIQNQYGIKTILINSANAAAKGYSLLHPDYNNLTYLSLPYGLKNGGQGHVINKQVIYGRNGIAGESTVYSARLQYSNNPDKLAKTDTGQMELLINVLLPVIGVIGPEVVALRTPMVNDMEELRKNLANYIPERFIPKLDYLNHQQAVNLILDGSTSICMDILNEEADKDKA